MNTLNYRVIVISNQACVGKGIISEKKLLIIHNYMKSILKKNIEQLLMIFSIHRIINFQKKENIDLIKKIENLILDYLKKQLKNGILI